MADARAGAGDCFGDCLRHRHAGDGAGDALVAARYPRCLLPRDALFGGLGAGEACAADNAGAARRDSGRCRGGGAAGDGREVVARGLCRTGGGAGAVIAGRWRAAAEPPVAAKRPPARAGVDARGAHRHDVCEGAWSASGRYAASHYLRAAAALYDCRHGKFRRAFVSHQPRRNVPG